MSYEEVAPNVSLIRTEEEFKLDFPEPAPPAPSAPEPNGPKKVALYAEFRARYNANGGAVDLAQLAVDAGVPLRWCRILMREVTRGKAEVYAPEAIE